MAPEAAVGDEFIGRAWALAEVEAWFVDRESPTLLVLGGPGTGKSALAAQLRSVDHAHFCRALSPETLDPLALVAALVKLLGERSPEFLSQLGRLVGQPVEVHGEVYVGHAEHSVISGVGNLHIGERSAVAAFNRTVFMPLTAMAPDDPMLGQDIVVLVDALDEALAFRGGETIPGFLRAIAHSELPLRLRWLLTSRAHDDAIRGLDVTTLDLVADAPDPLADVEAYARHRLSRLDEPVRSTVSRRVAEASAGNYLYARYVLNEIAGDPEFDPAALDLPEGLDTHYARFLDRERDRDQERWRDAARPVLAALAVARGAGLTRQDLAGAAELRESVLDDVLVSFRQYVEGPWPEGPLRPFHASFRAFVLGASDPDHRVYADEANEMVARYLGSQYGGDWDASEYALAHLPAHLSEAVAATAHRSRRADLEARLEELLTDPLFLDAKTGRLGIDATIMDLRVGADVTDSGSLRQLQRAADLIAQHVRGWDPDDAPALFLQQLGARAAQFGLADIAARSAQVLRSAGAAHLVLRWSAREESPALERLMTGHNAGVLGVAVTDGGLVFSTGWDYTLRVWDLETGAPRDVLSAHERYVDALAATPDGSRALSGDQAGRIVLWELGASRSGALPEIAGSGVLSLAITVDGTRALSGSADGVVRVWDLEAGSVAHELEVANANVAAVAFDGDGTRAAAGTPSGAIRVFDSRAGRLVHDLTGHEDAVRALAFTSGGLLVSGADDRTARVWDVDGRRCVAVMRGHEEGVRVVAPSRSGADVATGSDDTTICLWDLPSGAPQRVLDGHSGWVQGLAWTPDRRLVSGASDRSVRVWRPDAAPLGGTESRREVRAVAVSEAGRVVAGDEDGTVSLWDLYGGSRLSVLGRHGGHVTGVACWNERAISVSKDGSVRVWDLEAQAPVGVLDEDLDELKCLALVGDGELAVGEESYVRIYDLRTGECQRRLASFLMPPGVLSVAMTPSGRLVVGADRGTHRTAAPGSDSFLDGSFRTHDDGFWAGAVQSMAVTPGGRLLSGSDTHLRVYDPDSGELLDGVPSWDGGTVLAVAALGELAVFGGQDGVIQVYSLAARELVARAHTDAGISALAVEPRRGMVLTGDLGGQLSAWSLVGA